MIKHMIVTVVNAIGTRLFDIIMLVPMGIVRLIFLGVLVLLALWVLSLPPQQPDEGKKTIWGDLRLFALVVLVLQSLFYLIF